jgi:uncharacterized protein (TIGR02453 family)
MIDPKLLDFFVELKFNNSKDWFNERKADYTKMHKAFTAYLEEVALEVAKFDPEIGRRIGESNVVKVFRIYNDTRFAKDRPSLKTNISGMIGAGSMAPVYYLSISPESSMAGGGVRMPSSKVLTAIRAEIDANPDALTQVLDDKTFKKVFPDGLSGEGKLKTSPRNYSADHPAIELLKHKDFTSRRELTDEEVIADTFTKELVKTFKAQQKLNAFLYKALSRVEDVAA